MVKYVEILHKLFSFCFWRALRRSWKNDLRVVWYLVYHVLTFVDMRHPVINDVHQEKVVKCSKSRISRSNFSRLWNHFQNVISITLFGKWFCQLKLTFPKSKYDDSTKCNMLTNFGAKSMRNSYCDKISRKGLEKRFSKIRNSIARKIWITRFHSQPYIFAL